MLLLKSLMTWFMFRPWTSMFGENIDQAPVRLLAVPVRVRLVILQAPTDGPPNCSPTSHLLSLWTSSVQSSGSGVEVVCHRLEVEGWGVLWVTDEDELFAVLPRFHFLSFSVHVTISPAIMKSPTAKKLEAGTSVESRENGQSLGR